MSMYDIIDCSPEAKAMIAEGLEGTGELGTLKERTKYPFNQLLIGKAFVVDGKDMALGSLGSLRSSAVAYGKRNKATYKVILHKEYNCVEVARIG